MLFPLLTTALLLSGQDPAAIDERAAVQRLTLVESSPLETSLDSPDLPQTADVWKGMIVGARSELLLSHFYASTAPRSPLNDVIASVGSGSGSCSPSASGRRIPSSPSASVKSMASTSVSSTTGRSPAA